MMLQQLVSGYVCLCEYFVELHICSDGLGQRQAYHLLLEASNIIRTRIVHLFYSEFAV